jgi:hypothetical protein
VQLQHIDTVQNRLEISKKDWWIIIAAFVISRVVLYSVGYLGAVHYNAVVQHIAPFTFTNFVTEHVWDQFCQFDCAWFKNIAISGYDYYPHALTTGHAANWAFFPLFPIVGGWIAQFLGTEPLYGFYILSNLGSFTSLVFFYLCLRQLGHDQDNARYGIWVIPLAMFGFMLYLYIHTGDAFAYKDIQLAWTRAIGNPFDYWWDGFGDGGRKFYMSAAVSVGWLMNIYLFAKKRWAEAVFMLLCTFIPLSTSNNAFPRYLFGLYPTMLVLLMLVKGRPNLRALLLALSAIMSCFGVIAWVNSLFFMA